MSRTETILALFIILLGIVISLLWYLPTAQVGLLVGHSMEPTMSGGDLTIYEPSAADVGDVIVFEMETKSGSTTRVSHRVIMMNDTHYVTKGDNNDFMDKPVERGSEAYIGRVVYQIPINWTPPLSKPEMDLRAGS